MKLLFASDLHGSEHYVNLLTKRIADEKPERVILLGDLLYHGPRNRLPDGYDTQAAAALLNAIDPPPLCIRGNCDGEVDQMLLHFPILTDYAAILADGKLIYLTHGHHIPEASKALHAGDILFYGHTHIPAFEEMDGIYYVNPGSVSIPKNGSCHSYLIWEDGALSWRDVTTDEVYRREKLN